MERERTRTHPNVHRPEVLRIARLADQALDLLRDGDLLDGDRLGVRRDLQAEELVRDGLERLESARLGLVGPGRVALRAGGRCRGQLGTASRDAGSRLDAPSCC